MCKTLKTIITLAERATKKGTAQMKGRNTYGLQMTYEEKMSLPLEEKYRIEYTPNVQELYHWGTLTARIQNDKCVYIYGRGMADADSIYTFLNHFGIDRYELGYKPKNGGFYVRDLFKAPEDTESKDEYMIYWGAEEIKKHFDYVSTFYPEKDILMTVHRQERTGSGTWEDIDEPYEVWLDRAKFESSFIKERWEDEHRYNWGYHKQGYFYNKSIVHMRDSQGNIVRRTVRYFDFEGRETKAKEWAQRNKKGVA